MKIGIASDHQGYKLKTKLIAYLKNKNIEVIDYGTNNEESTDYPDYAFKIGEEINNNNISKGILICGSGIGMSIACNKVKGIRCAKVDNVEEAYMTRKDNDANVIALSKKVSFWTSKKIINTFLNTDYANIERYNRRLDKIKEYENK